MLFFAYKHPDVLVFVCFMKFMYTNNCKLILMAYVIVIIVLADVMPKVVADVIAIEVC